MDTPNVVMIVLDDLGSCAARVLYTEGSDVNDHTVSLALNGREVGAMNLSDNPLAAQFRLGRLVAGRDHGTPVCDDYRPLPFTGHIQRVVCDDLSHLQHVDLRQQIIRTIEND